MAQLSERMDKRQSSCESTSVEYFVPTCSAKSGVSTAFNQFAYSSSPPVVPLSSLTAASSASWIRRRSVPDAQPCAPASALAAPYCNENSTKSVTTKKCFLNFAASHAVSVEPPSSILPSTKQEVSGEHRDMDSEEGSRILVKTDDGSEGADIDGMLKINSECCDDEPSALPAGNSKRRRLKKKRLASDSDEETPVSVAPVTSQGTTGLTRKNEAGQHKKGVNGSLGPLRNGLMPSNNAGGDLDKDLYESFKFHGESVGFNGQIVLTAGTTSDTLSNSGGAEEASQPGSSLRTQNVPEIPVDNTRDLATQSSRKNVKISADKVKPEVTRTEACNNAVSDEDEISEQDENEEEERVASEALMECLQISRTMEETLVNRLGGSNSDGQDEIRDRIGNGRCCVYRSRNWPGEFVLLQEATESPIEKSSPTPMADQCKSPGRRSGGCRSSDGSRMSCGSRTSSKSKKSDGTSIKESSAVQPAHLIGKSGGNPMSRLKEYQRAGVQWLMALHVSDRNGILADEMGLGKTAQTCVFLNYLYSTAKAVPAHQISIVCAPASLLDNWMLELNRWAPNLRTIKYHGKQSDRRDIVHDVIERYYNSKSSEHPEESWSSDGPYQILVTSPQTLTNKWDEHYIRDLYPAAYLVVDEAHALKNKDSIVYKKMNKSNLCERRLLLTGSPIQNSTNELRNLLLFVMPLVFDRTSVDLALEYYQKQQDRMARQEASAAKTSASTTGDGDSSGNAVEEGMEGASAGNTNAPRLSIPALGSCESHLSVEVQFLQKLLSPFVLRRLKSEVLGDLPKKTSVVIRCQLEGRQKEMYCSEINLKKSSLALSLQALSRKLGGNRLRLDDEEEPEEPTQTDKRKRETNAERNNSAQDDSATGATVAATVVSAGSGELKNSEASEVGSETKSKTSCETSKPTVLIPSSGKTGKAGTRQPPTKFVNSMLFRLRRICNHTLLMQGQYSDDDMKRITDYYCNHVEGFRGNPRSKVEDELRSWSDYEMHEQACIIPGLSWAQLPSDLFLESAKIRELIRLVKPFPEVGEKALVFTQYTTYLNIIEAALQASLPSLIYRRLDGSTSVAERQSIVNDFCTNSDVTLFLLSTKAGGQGLNLTAAATVILMDQDWNPHTDRQAEDRVHRLGQTRDVTIYRLCCRGTVEESILKCCQKKLNLDEAFGGNSDLLQAAILKDSLASEDAIDDDCSRTTTSEEDAQK
eukprot:GHVQ01021454.1.p1 GENE.GHVQ01021454.1~~GHVQ01021454.1.p1  ORF type:complete len:1210 (+),score=183.06 GHVQ01021454.1:60-3689(+)